MRTMSMIIFSSLCLAFAAASSSFYSIGDWGGQDTTPYYTDAEFKAAAAVSKLAENEKPAFALLNGDNFYSSGIHGDATNFRFQSTFEDVFTGNDVIDDLDFYAVAGNHDWKGNVSAQIEHSRLSKRWNYPDYFYTVNATLSSGTPGSQKEYSVEIIMVDTVVLTLDFAVEKGDEDFGKQYEIPEDVRATNWWEWLTSAMESSTADFLFVAGHYPVYSPGSHGPTFLLELQLKPLLEKYNAHYLCGHDHIQAHIEYEGVAYVVAGSFHECCYAASHKKDVPAGALKYMHAASAQCSLTEEEEASAAAAAAQDAHIEEVHDTVDSGFAGIYFTDAGFNVKYYDNNLNVRYNSSSFAPRN